MAKQRDYRTTVKFTNLTTSLSGATYDFIDCLTPTELRTLKNELDRVAALVKEKSNRRA